MAKRVVLKVDEIQSPLDSTRKAIYYKEGSSGTNPGDVLIYSNAHGCFANEPMSTVGGVSTAVISTEMGIDVVTTNSGADTNYKFAAASPSTSGIKISEANDASIGAGGLQDGDHFMWDGTAQKWVNKPAPKVDDSDPNYTDYIFG